MRANEWSRKQITNIVDNLIKDYESIDDRGEYLTGRMDALKGVQKLLEEKFE